VKSKQGDREFYTRCRFVRVRAHRDSDAGMDAPPPLSDRFIKTAKEEADRLRGRMLDFQARGKQWVARGEELLEQAASLEARVRELDELLGRSPQLRVDLQDGVLQGQALREAAIRILAERRGIREPIHYREWYELLQDLGVRAGGKDPIATFLTQISRSPVVERVAQAGVYQLNPQAAYEIARESLHDASRLLAEVESSTNDHAGTDAVVAAAEKVQLARKQLGAVLKERQGLVNVLMAGDGERSQHN
jgi:hypothetical protein